MNRLKELRKEKNVYQTVVANYLKMSQNGYSQYETFLSNIPTIKLKKLAKFYNVSIDYILCLTDIKDSYQNSYVIPIESNMNRLKDVREDRDLLQTDICKILKMSQNGYSQYETGVCDIPIIHLITLCDYFDVSIDYLLYITDERKPHLRKKN